jgi:hypothetical protein
MVSDICRNNFIVFLEFRCIEIYKNYKLHWDAIRFETMDDYDLLPTEIYYVKMIHAPNKREAIKRGKCIFTLKILQEFKNTHF